MPSKQDLRSWCRLKYGNEWHATNKAERLAEARAKLSEPGPEERDAEASAAPVEAAAPPAEVTTPPPAEAAAPAAAAAAEPVKAAAAKPSASVSAQEARTWCRQKYGKTWFETEKTARLQEARAALAGDAVEASKPKSKKRPPPEAPESDDGAAEDDASEAEAPARSRPRVESDDEDDGAAAAEPTRALADLLEEPGNATAYLAMNKVVNAWNLLDFTDEMTDDGTTMKPVYRDDAERSRMLALMRDAIGGAAFDNVHGSDMEALLEAFAELSPDRQRLVRARAKRCVKKGAALGEVDVRAVLEAGLTVKL